MSWVENGTESVFLWPLQDGGRQPGSGNLLNSKKREINWDSGGTQTEISADTEASWIAKSINIYMLEGAYLRDPQ